MAQRIVVGFIMGSYGAVWCHGLCVTHTVPSGSIVIEQQFDFNSIQRQSVVASQDYLPVALSSQAKPFHLIATD